MKLRFSLAAFLAFVGLSSVGSLRAQSAGTPIAVPVRMVAQAVTYYTAASTGPAQVTISGTGYPTPSSSTGAFSTMGRNAGTTSLVPLSTGYATAMLEPGKVYAVTVSGSNVQGPAFYAAAGPGYQIQINGMLRQSISVAQTSSTTGSYYGVYSVQVLAPSATDGAPAGTASSIASGRILWSVSLGTLKNGTAAGSIVLADSGTEASWSALFTPAALQFESSSVEVVDWNDGNGHRQIDADQAFVDIVQITSTSYELRFYDPDSAVASTSGSSAPFPYTFSGDPFVVYQVSQVGSGTKLQITRAVRQLPSPASSSPVVRTDVTSIERTGASAPYSWTLLDWTESGGSQLVEESRGGSAPNGNHTETISVLNPSSNVTALTTTATYYAYPWGESLLQSVSGTSNPVTTSYDYYTDSTQAGTGSYGLCKSMSSSLGWQAFDYQPIDFSGTVGTTNLCVLSGVYSPYKNDPLSASTNQSQGVYTSYTYDKDAFQMYTRPAVVQTQINGVTVAKSATSYVVNDTPINSYTPQDGAHYFIVTATTAVSTNATNAVQSVRKYFQEDVSDDFLRSQTYSIQQADGVQQSFAYQRGTYSASAGTFSPAASGSDVRLTTITGVVSSSPTYKNYAGFDIDPLNLVDGKSTLTAVIRDHRALTVRTESYVWSSGAWQLLDYTTYAYDCAGHLTTQTASNGLGSSATYNGDRKMSETDVSGVTISYTYDAAGRVQTESKSNGPTKTFSYDAAGDLLSTTVSASPATAETLVDSATYDDAGRVKSQTPVGLGEVQFTYDPTNRTKTTTLPDGNSGTKIETYNLDGSLSSVTGTAVVPEYYTYNVNADGTKTVQVNVGSASSVRWQLKKMDWMGRVIHTEKPGYSSVSVQSNYVEDFTFDPSTGRLTEVQRTGQAPILYQYDEFSRVNRSGLYLGTSGGLTLASNDRITDSNQYIEYYNNAWWLHTDIVVYPTANSSTGVTTSIVRKRLSGFPANRIEETQVTDLYNNTVIKTVDVNASSATVTTTTTRPDMANSATETVVNGLASSVTGFDGKTATKSYDPLERLSKVTDPRSNSTTYLYYANTALLNTVKDAAGNPTNFGYDGLGRRLWTSDALGNVTYASYTAQGQIWQTWGAGTDPVQYGYDPIFGDRTTMTTYRDATNSVSWTGSTWPTGVPANLGDTTTWTYDQPTGLLWKKTDAANKPVIFDYTQAGQVYTRTWARGVKTTYAYDAQTGELTGQTYSDSTPSVSYSYTRTGQLNQVTDATGTRTFNYDSSYPLRLQNEALDATFYASRRLTALYDANTTTSSGGAKYSFTLSHLLGRPNGVSLGIAGNESRDLQQSFAYSNQGQFAYITSQVAGNTSRDFAYTYDANDMLSGYGTGSFGVNYQYDPQRNLRTEVSSAYSSTAITRFDYGYTSLGQRQWAMLSGTAYSDYYAGTTYSHVYNYYVYNARGELTSTAMYKGDTAPSSASGLSSANELPGRRYMYTFDNAGNRLSAGQTGDPAQGDDVFTPNNLNQYSSRENNSVHVVGTAAANATVANLYASVSKNDRAYSADIVPPNTNGAATGSLTMYAALPGAGTGGADIVSTMARSWFVPPALQTFTYDADGNMTSDGVWSYQYDAENRLVAMNTSLINGAGFTRYDLQFKYDYLGRRVEKIVGSVSEVDNSVQTILDHKFIYDGWSLVAETDASGNMTRAYTWGLDLTGSLNATAGVGALLQITNVSGTTTTDYFPTYDGNGNVAALVRSDGVLAAAYEYTPAGQSLRKGVYDTNVADNPFRFSTKFTDSESGLVYYGSRYYSPSLGRFINRDPIEEAGGLNLYGFCGNDGVDRFDILGHSWLSKLWNRTIGSLGRHIAMNWDHGRRYVMMAAAIVASIWVGWEVADMVYQANAVTFAAATAAQTAAGSLGTVTVTANAGLLGSAVGTSLTGQILATAAAGIAGGAAGGAVAGGMMSGSLRGALSGAESGAIAGGIGGFIKGMADVGMELATGSHLQPNRVTFDQSTQTYDVQSIADPSTITGKQNIFVNGMMNSFTEAVRNGGNFFKNQSFILEYSPSYGLLPDVAEASVEKLTGISSEGSDLAALLEQIDPNGSTLFMHSRGALVGMDAFRSVIADGHSLSGLTVSGYGGAANAATVRYLTSGVGAHIGSWSINAFDAVPNIAGGDAIFAPWRAATSLLAAPLLFAGHPGLSPHSSLTGTGQTFWSIFNSGL